MMNVTLVKIYVLNKDIILEILMALKKSGKFAVIKNS